jgi:hypothetical protein
MFLEEFKDIFGFDDEVQRMQDEKPKVMDERPIMPFNSNQMMEHLARLRVGVHRHGFQDFNNTVQWGRGPGAIRVKLGSQYTVYIERLIHDLEGKEVWIDKKCFKINVDEYKQYVESVGDAIHDEVQKIAMTNIEGARKDFDDIEGLAEEIRDEMNNYSNNMFVFDRIKKVNDHNAILVYYVKGGGVGALQKPRSEGKMAQVIIDVNHNRDTGIIRIMNTAVVSGDEGVTWHLMPSFFAGEYVPGQDFREIAETVVTAMKWF